MKKFWSIVSGLFGCLSIVLGSVFFGNLGVAIGWILMFVVMALSDYIYFKRNRPKDGHFYLHNTPWAAMGSVVSTMVHAIMVGLNEE